MSTNTSAPTGIRVRVLLFSVLREMLNASELTVDLGVGATGEVLLDRLTERFPILRPYRDAVRLAVNERYVEASHSLNDGDEVALITAVSGG